MKHLKKIKIYLSRTKKPTYLKLVKYLLKKSPQTRKSHTRRPRRASLKFSNVISIGGRCL